MAKISPDEVAAFIRSEGMTNPFGIAAMLSTIDAESAFNPEAVFKKEGSHGFFQHRLSRWTALKKFAKDAGTSWKDWKTQVRFSLGEMRNHPTYGKVFKTLQNAKNPTEAIRAMVDFERPKGWKKGGRWKLTDIAGHETRVGKFKKYMGAGAGGTEGGAIPEGAIATSDAGDEYTGPDTKRLYGRGSPEGASEWQSRMAARYRRQQGIEDGVDAHDPPRARPEDRRSPLGEMEALDEVGPDPLGEMGALHTTPEDEKGGLGKLLEQAAEREAERVSRETSREDARSPEDFEQEYGVGARYPRGEPEDFRPMDDTPEAAGAIPGGTQASTRTAMAPGVGGPMPMGDWGRSEEIKKKMYADRPDIRVMPGGGGTQYLETNETGRMIPYESAIDAGDGGSDDAEIFSFFSRIFGG